MVEGRRVASRVPRGVMVVEINPAHVIRTPQEWHVKGGRHRSVYTNRSVYLQPGGLPLKSCPHIFVRWIPITLRQLLARPV